jgi:hypothetical protein
VNSPGGLRILLSSPRLTQIPGTPGVGRVLDDGATRLDGYCSLNLSHPLSVIVSVTSAASADMQSHESTRRVTICEYLDEIGEN